MGTGESDVNDRLRARPALGVLSSDRAVIFAFFVAGAAFARFTAISFPVELPDRLLYGGILTAVALLSLSVLGTYTIPALALLLGALVERSAALWLCGWDLRQVPDLRAVGCAALLVPAFFLTATHGMAASASILASLGRGSPSARATLRQELAVACFFAVLGLAAVFFFY